MEIRINEDGVLLCDGLECISYASNYGCLKRCPLPLLAERILRGKQVDLFGLVPTPTPKESSFKDCSLCRFGGNCVFNPCPLEMGWHFKIIEGYV